MDVTGIDSAISRSAPRAIRVATTEDLNSKGAFNYLAAAFKNASAEEDSKLMADVGEFFAASTNWAIYKLELKRELVANNISYDEYLANGSRVVSVIEAVHNKFFGASSPGMSRRSVINVSDFPKDYQSQTLAELSSFRLAKYDHVVPRHYKFRESDFAKFEEYMKNTFLPKLEQKTRSVQSGNELDVNHALDVNLDTRLLPKVFLRHHNRT